MEVVTASERDVIPERDPIPRVDQELRSMQVGDCRRFAGFCFFRIRNRCARILGKGRYTTRQNDGILTVWRIE